MWTGASGTKPLLGCRPWGLWEAGLGQASPLGPQTKERSQLPPSRQPACFLPTPKSLAGAEACPGDSPAALRQSQLCKQVRAVC